MYNFPLLNEKNKKNITLFLSYRNTKYKKNSLSKTEQHFLERAHQVIAKNIQNKQFTVSEFANQMCMGRGNLYRLIKSLTGLSPNYIISKARLNTGKFLLENSDLRVNEIAEEVGYSDYAYFSRAFRKHFGYPPSQVRA